MASSGLPDEHRPRYPPPVSTSTLTRPESAPPPTTRPVDRDRTGRILALICVGLPTLVILLVMSGAVASVRAIAEFPFVDINWETPALLVASTPTGGDMGAHVYLPQFLKETLLPAGKIIGWSQDWYAGFPALYFYFPIPALFTVLLDVVIPYGVAFKLTTILGLLLLPSAVYYFTRSMGFDRVVSGLTAATASGYVFMESFSIFGANVKSTMAGEYSFGWSFALSLFYLGLLMRQVDRGKGFSPWAGVLLALTALTHVVTTMVAVVVSLPLLARRNGPRVVISSWVVGFALAAFWALPMAVRVFQGMTSDMHWSPVRGLLGDGFASQVSTPLPNELIPFAVLAVIGLLWTTLRGDRVLVLVTMTVVPFVAYWVLQLDGIDFTKVYNARFLPYWYLGVYIFAGLTIGLTVRAVARYFPERGRNLVYGTAIAAIFVTNVTLAGIHDVPGWVRWNFAGFEMKEAWPEYEAIMETADSLPAGRIMWEANSPEMGKYGTPLAFMLYPYWTFGSHPSMEGLFFESSLTTPFHFLNAAELSARPSNPVRGLNYHNQDFDRGITHLKLYGVDYYAAWTSPDTGEEVADEEAPQTTVEMAREYGLEELAVSGPVTFFEVPHTELVEVAGFEPTVWDGDEPFLDATLSWYDLYETTNHPMVERGPEEWPRIDDIDGPFNIGEPLPGGAVSDIVVDHERISFHTTAVGQPHIVKVSYFPAWAASGADGPYRAAPSIMIVVPTQEDVVIEFRNGVPENVGSILTVVSIIGLGAWIVIRRRRRRAEPPQVPAQ